MGSQSKAAGQHVPDLHPLPGTGAISAAVTPMDLVARGGVYGRVAKPLIDRALSLTGLLLLLPLLALIATGILLTSGRPIFFRQQRVGKGGQSFHILKFRTMLQDRRKTAHNITNVDRRGYHKSDADPRHTPFGRFLRRYSLDELPQLLNIVRGDMSLVGPRPELPHVVAGYEPWQHQRHLVRPGLTGPWQISARGDGPMHEFAQLDIDYVSKLSLRHDLALLRGTFPALFSRKGH